MTMNGPTLIFFSAAFLVAAGLLGQEGKRRAVSDGLANTIAARNCMDEGLVTPAGRIGCITPVISPLSSDFVTTTLDYRGGGALNR
ncbi:MAG: hypothetical protein QNJ44_19400 [Rhodobacter sp.]|nr:hypothetical protein [Rhodobacter sp.]